MVTSVNSKMTAIADAIRNLLDISGTMGLDAMASNISSITKRGAVAGTISTKSEQYIIPAGYHNGNGTVGIDVAEQAKIIAENIKNGVTILGVSGTASGDAYAAIAVTYPAGSVCTCSDGTKTLTLKDTSGQGFFLIPYAAVWTVTASDGTNTKAQSVEITSEGQSKSVTLSYEVFLFNNGAVVPFSSEAQSEATVSIGNTISFGSGSGSSLYQRGAVAYTKSKIDLTEYTSVVFEGSFTKVMNSSAARSLAGVITQTPSADPGQDNLYAAKTYLDVTNSSWTVDISELSGEYYVSVSAGYSDAGNLIGSITRIYLA